jgi:anti-sigma B factor antagonist
MKLEILSDTLRVTEVKELGAANSNAFRDWVRSSLQAGQRNIEIDLSETRFVDSCGLGALVALHKTACNRKGTVRLLHPQPSVKQILDLTRMNKIFEIVSPAAAVLISPQPMVTATVAA